MIVHSKNFDGLLHNKPFFKNGCCHDEGSYIGSAEFDFDSDGLKHHKIDVYVFKNSIEYYVCVREGDAENAYRDLGELLYFLDTQTSGTTDFYGLITLSVIALLKKNTNIEITRTF